MKYFLDTEFHERVISIENKSIDTIELISIGITSENGEQLYLISKDFDIKEAWKNDWLRDNVLHVIWKDYFDGRSNSFIPVKLRGAEFNIHNLTNLISEIGVSRDIIKERILDYIDDNPEFYAYYADYDWVVFCWIFGRMIDLPPHFPMYCIDIKQIIDDKCNSLNKAISYGLTDEDMVIPLISHDSLKLMPEYPKNELEHNALDDSFWNRSLFYFIEKIKL